ncbi:MAG: curved DNA-binding protein [Halioglobus sp.]
MAVGDSSSYSAHRDREQSFRQRGRDVQVDTPIFLEDTLPETQKPLSFHLNGEDKNLKVKIPAGVTEGEKKRLKRQGGAGQGDAALGAKVEVPTITGKVRLAIPPGS